MHHKATACVGSLVHLHQTSYTATPIKWLPHKDNQSTLSLDDVAERKSADLDLCANRKIKTELFKMCLMMVAKVKYKQLNAIKTSIINCNQNILLSPRNNQLILNSHT